LSNSGQRSAIQSIQGMDARNRRNLEYLESDLVKYGGILPFVGAGLSVPLGFPGWTQFLQEEATLINMGPEISHLLDDGQYEEAAELLSERLGFREFEDSLERAFGEQKLANVPPADSAVMFIPKLTSGPVITTNFDRALERSFEVFGWPFSDKVWGNSSDLLTRAIIQDRHVLLKMHGDIVERRDRVLTVTEYKQHYGEDDTPDYRKPLPQLLRRLFESRPLLFLGCSLNRDRTLRVLRQTALETNSQHYAIVEAPADAGVAEQRRTDLSNSGIRAILYPTGEHGLVTQLLIYLAEKRVGNRTADSPRTMVTSAGAAPGHASEQRRPVGDSALGIDPWSGYGWSYVVHEQLEEKLAYYLVRIRPYNRETAARGLEALVAAEGLGTVRAYELFGTYDLLIRAWLPSGLINKFDALLPPRLACQGIQSFSANAVCSRWYRAESQYLDADQRRLYLLTGLSRSSIQAVQVGLQPVLLEDLLKAGLAFDRTPLPSSTITFFVSVNFEEDLGLGTRDSVIREIEVKLTKDSRLKRITIDRGFGFCEILIKAESEDFYAIGEVPNWISKRFEAYRTITETFLSKYPVHISGDGRIGSATFDALDGKDNFVRHLLPELYPKRKVIHEEVELFLKAPLFRSLGSGGRKFVHDFLLGVIREKRSEYATVLFKLFSEWETFLRQQHREFLGRRGVNLNELYSQVNVSAKRPDDFTLVDVLQVYSRGTVGTDLGEKIGTDWQALTSVRNAAIHNKEELADWGRMLSTVLGNWQKMKVLVSTVESETRGVFEGTYREE
jgi:hypothetical protein